MRKKTNVLVVDDDEQVRHMTKRMLELKKNFDAKRIITAGTGEEALKLLQERQVQEWREAIHLVFCDVVLPEKTGLEVAKEAKELPNPPFIIAMSGYGDDPEILKNLLGRVNSFLSKPFDAKNEELIEALEEFDKFSCAVMVTQAYVYKKTNKFLWTFASYDEKEDALRIMIKPVEAPHQEWLTFGFEKLEGSSAVAYLHWEKLKIPFSIKLAE